MSREIDALIAEHVTGLHRTEWMTLGPEDEEAMELIWWDLSEPPGLNMTQVPKYSTDISAAWEIVEQLAEEGIYTLVDQIKSTCHVVMSDIDDTIRGENVAETAPMAICLAALEVKEVKI
jgi:hypothetical protein